MTSKFSSSPFSQLVQGSASASAQSLLKSSHSPTSNNPMVGHAFLQPSSLEEADAKAKRQKALATLGEALERTPPPETRTDSPKKSQRFSDQKASLMALKEKVQDIHMHLVMHLADAVGGQDGKKNKYKIEGLGNIELTGQRWYCWNMEKGGVGPINFLMWANKLTFSQAVHLLANEFGATLEQSDIKAAKDQAPKEKKFFDPPHRIDKNIEFVKHYLHFKRAIPLPLIEELILDGRIYADEHKNCVFYAQNIAELRSSHDGEDAVKKLVPGSIRDHCFTVPADTKALEQLPENTPMSVAICESSIDAMSFRTIYPHCIAVSAAGAGRDFPRRFADTMISNGFQVIAAFDADAAGDKATQSLFNHFFIKQWITQQFKHKGVEIDEEVLFELMDNGVIDSTLGQRSEDKPYNIIFFGKEQAFDDPKMPPTILLSVKDNPLGIPTCEEFPIEITPEAIEFIIHNVGLSRERPQFAKDWNEQLKQHRMQPQKNKNPL